MSEVPATAPEPTGNESVDAVLDLVSGLDGRPLPDHVTAFEEAHSRLRGALDQPDDDA